MKLSDYITIFTGVCAFLSLQPCIASTQLNIDTSQTQQEMDGFGASDAWTFDPMIKTLLKNGQQEQIEYLADTLFSVDKGIGLTAWRFNIGAGSDEQGDASQILPSDTIRRAQLLQPAPGAPIDPSKQTGQIRFLQEAVERGVPDLIAFSNSPPVWATHNGLARANESTGSTNLRPEMAPQFAQFLVDVVSYLREQKGIPINYISPVNEPTWEWADPKQEGNRYNNQELINVYRALYTKLQQAGLEQKVAIEAGETVEYKAALSDNLYQQFVGTERTYNAGMNKTGLGLYRNYIDALLGPEDLRAMLGNKISLHGYFADADSRSMGTLRDLVWQNLQESAPGSKIWMSEICILGGTGDVRHFRGPGWDVNDMEYALHVGKMLHRDLTRLNASAWHWWLAVTAGDYKDGLIKVAPDFDGMSLQTSKVLWTLGQYSRFIRPGFTRVELTGADNLNGLMASAFINPQRDKLVVVAVNASAQSEAVTFALKGLGEGQSMAKFRVFLTNQNNDLAEQPEVSLTKPAQIPANSIITYVGSIPDKDTSSLSDLSKDSK